jgi:MraZ protein
VAYTEARIAEILESAKDSSISRQQARDFKRIFGGEGAMESLDKQGRILLSDGLKNYAGITKEVTIVGAVDSIEFWDAATYEERRQTARDYYDSIAGKVIR